MDEIFAVAKVEEDTSCLDPLRSVNLTKACEAHIMLTAGPDISANGRYIIHHIAKQYIIHRKVYIIIIICAAKAHTNYASIYLLGQIRYNAAAFRYIPQWRNSIYFPPENVKKRCAVVKLFVIFSFAARLISNM